MLIKNVNNNDNKDDWITSQKFVVCYLRNKHLAIIRSCIGFMLFIYHRSNTFFKNNNKQ